MMKEGKRLADEFIYLSEDRYENPKELFKFIANKLEKNGTTIQGKLLDVGCATGELIYYLKQRFSRLNCTGIDISAAMIEKAKNKLPSEQFFVKSIFDGDFFKKKKFDYVICCGVLNIFDDVRPAIDNLLACTKVGGKIFIAGTFNEDPVDVIMRYKLIKKPTEEWQTGWNVFSKATFENILSESERNSSCQWHDFKMPFDIPKKDDPMRTWTIKTEDNPHQLVNGASQLIHIKILEISLSDMK